MHLLVVWWLVNLQDARCNNKDSFSLICLSVLYLLLSVLSLHQILEFISVYSNLSSYLWFSMPNNYYNFCVFFTWDHKVLIFRLIRHDVFPDKSPSISTCILKPHTKCLATCKVRSITCDLYLFFGWPLLYTECRCKGLFLHVTTLNYAHTR